MRYEFWKLFISAILATILVFPILYMLLNKTARIWLKVGIEGENNRLDLNEIWEMIYMYMSIGCYLLFVFMIVNKTVFGIAYTWEEYTLSFLGTAGSNGVSAWIIYVKNKFKK